jgi:hypothetical protein
MPEIPLSRGLVALVDDEDYEWLSQWRWCASANGYAVRMKRKGEDGFPGYVSMHRSIMAPSPGEEVDHKNRNGLDNRRSNLRLATGRQNKHNTGPRRRGTSGFKGVTQCGPTRWAAQIYDGSRRHLGIYESAAEAAAAYDEAARGSFGEFAWLNFPPP